MVKYGLCKSFPRGQRNVVVRSTGLGVGPYSHKCPFLHFQASGLHPTCLVRKFSALQGLRKEDCFSFSRGPSGQARVNSGLRKDTPGATDSLLISLSDLRFTQNSGGSEQINLPKAFYLSWFSGTRSGQKVHTLRQILLLTQTSAGVMIAVSVVFLP